MNKSELRIANQNPWYLMMTLHGDVGGTTNWEASRENARSWNVFVLSGLSDVAQQDAKNRIGEAYYPETPFDDILPVLKEKYEEQWNLRNPKGGPPPAMPDARRSPQLTNTLFSQPLEISNMLLPAHTTFSESVFEAPLLMLSGVALGVLVFDKTVFDGKVMIVASQLIGHAHFNQAVFKGVADFQFSTFHQTASFTGASFDELADFREVQFEGAAKFTGWTSLQTEGEFAHFGTATLFSGARFSDRADFFRRRFGPYETPANSLTFANAIFQGPVSFEDAAFPDVMPVLTNTSLPASTKVTAIKDLWPPLKTKSTGERGLAHREAEHTSATQDPEIIKASSAALRHAMSRQMLPEEEHFFFRREMWAAGRTGPWLRRLPVLFYGAVSDYGHSISRPTLLLAALWVVGALIYATQLGFSVVKALVYSFAVMFKFFGLQGTYLKDETGDLSQAMEFFAGGQTVMAFIVLFFLGLGLRTRFRLR
ncbi:pentapeptide repeat-containing protein [Loktanella sp. Alg231-35]|uniref:pentapeptide repeat-containing protein n=1 Tax=Loktanella sp. Alg231-35 TaxID=1922220 RepID=UPI001F1D0396|nr:pentapeptide repeat-containing protein [Loktanella sp. Alg231-35]